MVSINWKCQISPKGAKEARFVMETILAGKTSWAVSPRQRSGKRTYAELASGVGKVTGRADITTKHGYISSLDL
jgi:hypothetical protein